MTFFENRNFIETVRQKNGAGVRCRIRRGMNPPPQFGQRLPRTSTEQAVATAKNAVTTFPRCAIK